MKYISALLFVFIIAVIILADKGNLPHSIRAIYDFPNGDKLGHFILFGLLNFFLTRTLLSSFPSKPRRWMALLVCLTLALLIALEEYSQRFFSTRTFDMLDLLASYLGLLIAGGAAYKMKSG
jgi:polysaccharide biosynthesis protein VpsQ